MIRKIGVGVALCAIIAVAVVAFATRPAAPEQSAGDVLTARLVKLGVPVRSVVVTSQSPLRVTITYTTDCSANKVADVDLWNDWLVNRVAMLSYLDGLPLACYKVVEVNPKGEETASGDGSLSPTMPSQQLKVGAVLSPVDDAATRTRLVKTINTQGLPIAALIVTSGGAVRPNTQLVELHLIAPSPQATTKVLNLLLGSLHQGLDLANQNSGTRIAVLRLKVIQPDGTLLFHFISDLEASMNIFASANGVDAGYPRPAERPTSPLNSPLPTP
jgi:hypothetical protein